MAEWGNMSKRDTIEEKTTLILEPILEKMGFDLWDVEYVKEGPDMYLRAYIDKEGGITIDDCVDVSHALSDAIDADDYIEDAYILEVSSPGLGRQLKKDKEFQRSIGRDIDVKLYKALDGTKEFTGTLTAFDKYSITIEAAGETKAFNRTDVAKVNLTLDI